MESIYQPGRSRFADDLALLSHTHSHILEKSNRLRIYSKQVDLNIREKETEKMFLNVQDPAPLKVEHCHTQSNSHSLLVLTRRTSRKLHQQQNWKGQECLQNA